ncbi:reverse transcriptase domain-containing protein [Tanacetum coccineum]
MIIEAEIGGHCIHRMYVDGGSASKILYEHCFSRIRPEIKNQLIPATTPLIGFSGEIIWPIRQIQLLVKIGDEEHSTSAWMNFVVVRSPSLYNGIIRRPPEGNFSAAMQAVEERIKVAINLEFLEQTEGCSPVRQKKRGRAADRNQAIQEEVGKLAEVGIVKEVHYHDWLSNPVMVKKHDDSWRIRIHHQIQMAKEDEEKTTFITSQGIFCYTKMPFGLRNARATYHRLVDKAFHKQIGRNLEVYMDDLVIKSRTEDEIVRDIEETFKTLREINMKLNPKKCTFGVEEGMFLGYKVNTRGLKKARKPEQQLIAELPMLTAPMEKEELIVYMAAAKKTVSAVLMTERVAKQMPIYFVSKALSGPEINYTSMEKLVLALVHASKRLKRYFQAYYSNHGPADTGGVIKTEDSSRLHSRMTRRGLSGYSDGSGRRTPRTMDFVYGRIILHRWFDATNNEAEYEALIVGLRIAEQMGVKNLQANVDSRLVANQVNGTYVAKEVDMIQYLEKVRTLTSSFKAFSIRQVPRSENKKADALSKIASTSFAHLSKQVLVEELKEKSISEVEILAVVEEEEDTWMTHIFEYLTEETLPTDLKKQEQTLIRACKDCQVHKPVPRNPQQKLTPIMSLWSFYKWGIDIAGPFPEGPGKDNPFKDWCKKLCIRQHFASVKHPQTNGPVERANRSLGEGIKARLEARSKNWMKELPHVLWAHRTMIKSSNRDTPFALTYRMEAVVPAEIGMPTLRTAEVDLVKNNEALEINLDLLEERREEATIREAKSKAKMEMYYNSKILVLFVGGALLLLFRSIDYGELSARMHRLNESSRFSNSSQPRQVVGILQNPFSQSDASLTTGMKPIKVKKNAHPYLGDGSAMDGKQIPSPMFFDIEANSTSFGELKTVSAMNPSSKSGRDDDKEAQSPIMPMKKSFVNVVADTKSVPKVNFRTLNNDEKVDDSDFVLPMDVITGLRISLLIQSLVTLLAKPLLSSL